ncbi:hypothetical protein DOY81_004880 [Sarcophaga bullata]|nr:hypothetical protein DOY81_004880 [Sarcophaga bullata]
MSDEEDYMSDKFLAGLQDLRPSLVNNRAKKRQIDIECKQKERIKKQKEVKLSTAVVDNDRLQAALSKPLAEENKGFKLLAKMGYKPGQALGKITSNDSSSPGIMESRLTEPIGITLKTDRQGLGRQAALQELNERRQKIREQRLKKKLGGETSIEEFRRRTNQKYEEKFVLNAFKRCQVTCENLDLESKVNTPELPWFWPERIIESKESDEEDPKKEDNNDLKEEQEEFSNSEKLEMLTNYIRTSYLFCYWCGVRYNNEEDLNDNCPGLTKDDH